MFYEDNVYLPIYRKGTLPIKREGSKVILELFSHKDKARTECMHPDKLKYVAHAKLHFPQSPEKEFVELLTKIKNYKVNFNNSVDNTFLKVDTPIKPKKKAVKRKHTKQLKAMTDVNQDKTEEQTSKTPVELAPKKRKGRGPDKKPRKRRTKAEMEAARKAAATE